MTSSQHSGQSGGSSCGGNSGGYSPWGPGPGHQFNPPENFYNNPILPFPNGPTTQMQPHRYQITPPNQQPPPIPSYYPSTGNRNIHSHYPPSHSHSDYQPFNHNHNRKCKNTR